MENQTMSTNTKWTYTLGDNQNHHNGRVTDNATGELIARRAVMSPDDAAVMHLIAAAPELLSALEKMLKEHDIITDNDPSVRRGDDRWPHSATAARAAITKAKRRAA